MSRVVRRLQWEKRRFLQKRFMAQLRHEGAEIGPGATVVRSVHVGIAQRRSIGAGSRIHRNCVLKGLAPISIGRFCEIAEGVHIVSSNHGTERANLHVGAQHRSGAEDLREIRGPVRIGHNVWIGDNAIVLSGVTVGNGAVIGAGAVVTRDVSPFAVVAGSPARAIRQRFSDEVVALLEELAWWDLPEEQMHRHRDLFERDLTAADAADYLRVLTGRRGGDRAAPSLTASSD